MPIHKTDTIVDNDHTRERDLLIMQIKIYKTNKLTVHSAVVLQISNITSILISPNDMIGR